MIVSLIQVGSVNTLCGGVDVGMWMWGVDVGVDVVVWMWGGGMWGCRYVCEVCGCVWGGAGECVGCNVM